MRLTKHLMTQSTEKWFWNSKSLVFAVLKTNSFSSCLETNLRTFHREIFRMSLLKNFLGRNNILAMFSLLIFIVFAGATNKIKYLKGIVSDNKIAEYRISGGCNKKLSPYLTNSIDLDARITYCSTGDGDINSIAVAEFQSRGKFVIYTAGYFGAKVQLVFEVDGKVVSPLEKINASPGEAWTAQKITLPIDGNKEVKITLIDGGSSFKEWGGISIPTSNNQFYDVLDQVQVVFWVILFFIVSFSITHLSYLCVKKFTQLDVIIITSIFIFLCCIYYLSFWIYYLSHNIGLLFSYFIISLSLFTLFKSYFRGDILTPYALKIYLLPILYVIVLFTFSLSYGDSTSIQKTAATIFTHELPIDNFLPKIFADQVYSQNLSKPMIGDWLSSDRPPLQAGQFLFFYKLFSGSDAGYQLMSMLLQAYCLIPLILLINFTIKENNTLRFLVFISLAFSSVILVNSIFVWPKLVAGGALLFITYILLNIELFKNKTMPIILSATLAMISMLAHSGSIFALIPIAIISLFIFKPKIRGILAATSIAILMFGPWIFYQKKIDPPGDRLIKWHLAGQIEINSISFADAVKEAYMTTPSKNIIAAKISNFKNLFKGVLSYDYSLIPIKIFNTETSNFNSIYHVKTKLFFDFFYSMGVIFIFGLISGLTLLVINRRVIFNSLLILFFIAPTASVTLWCLLMFEAGSTVIHQGAYFPWLAFMFIFSIFISLLFRRFSLLIFFSHFLINFSVYFLSVMMHKDISNALIFSIYIISFFTLLIFSYKFIGCNETQSPIRNIYAK